jgi:hypothetical protein
MTCSCSRSDRGSERAFPVDHRPSGPCIGSRARSPSETPVNDAEGVPVGRTTHRVGPHGEGRGSANLRIAQRAVVHAEGLGHLEEPDTGRGRSGRPEMWAPQGAPASTSAAVSTT